MYFMRLLNFLLIFFNAYFQRDFNFVCKHQLNKN